MTPAEMLIERLRKMYGDTMTGAYETAASIGSGMPAQVIGGVQGIGAGINQLVADTVRGRFSGMGDRALDEAAKRSTKTQDALTYEPKSDVGQRGLQNVGNVIEPVAEYVKTNVADRVAEAGSPATAAGLIGIANVVGGKGKPKVKPQGFDASPSVLAEVIRAPKGERLSDTTVMRPERNAFPGVYANPREMVAEAAARVAPEDPLLKQLFGVTRDDLWQISQQGTRQGNITERPFKTAENPKGAAHAEQVTNPRNAQRIQNLIEVAREEPKLFQPMAAWYVNDPLYKRFVELHGPEVGLQKFNQYNTLTGMASPGSEVLTEINRGSAANMLAEKGRFGDFTKFGGVKESARGADFPEDMRSVISHPYHQTAQAGPMGKYLERGQVEMGSAKVPSYIAASGVPESGFQTQFPVGDAHWSRIMGLADVRPGRTRKGESIVPAASASVPEMVSLGPWFRDKIATPAGLEAVPAQAVVWGAGSGATGVTSPIGAGKLELTAQQIGKAARRMGVSPETARDMIIMGKAHAGKVSPELAAGIAGGGSAAALVAQKLREKEEQK